MSFFAEYAIALFFYMYKTHIKYKIILLQLAVKHIKKRIEIKFRLNLQKNKQKYGE